MNHFDKTMRSSIKIILAILTVFSMVLSGCTEASIDSAENDENKDEINDMPLPDCELNDSCFEPEEQLVMIPHSDGCDNINPIHCMLPFPSDAFLVDDETKVTGKRIDYSPTSLPGSGSKSIIEIPLISGNFISVITISKCSLSIRCNASLPVYTQLVS